MEGNFRSDLELRRRKVGISRTRLAVMADCSPSMLALLEEGYTPQSGEVLGRVKDALARLEQRAAAAR